MPKTWTFRRRYRPEVDPKVAKEGPFFADAVGVERERRRLLAVVSDPTACPEETAEANAALDRMEGNQVQS